MKDLLDKSLIKETVSAVISELKQPHPEDCVNCQLIKEVVPYIPNDIMLDLLMSHPMISVGLGMVIMRNYYETLKIMKEFECKK